MEYTSLLSIIMANELCYPFMQQALVYGTHNLKPGTRVVYRVPMDAFNPQLGYSTQRVGYVQYIRNDDFETLYSWPKGILRYSVYFPRTELLSECVEPWVLGAWLTKIPGEVPTAMHTSQDSPQHKPQR